MIMISSSQQKFLNVWWSEFFFFMEKKIAQKFPKFLKDIIKYTYSRNSLDPKQEKYHENHT